MSNIFKLPKRITGDDVEDGNVPLLMLSVFKLEGEYHIGFRYRYKEFVIAFNPRRPLKPVFKRIDDSDTLSENEIFH